MLFDPKNPYNHLPKLPVKNQVESKEILKACIEARTELAKLEMAGNLLPNPTVLINSIPLLESQASSLIENIVTTTDELFQFAGIESDNIPGNVKETLRYRQALHYGFQAIKEKPLNVTIMCKLCSLIKDREMEIRKIPGTSLINDRSKEIIYTPPVGEAVLRDLLSNWQDYIHSDDNVDPLIKLAIQHYQFEAIHPFSDGNGRTGRIINLLFLLDKNLLTLPILYLSRYLNHHKSDYYLLLLDVTRNNNWQDWILFILEAVRHTAKWTTEKILAIQTLIKESCHIIQSNAPSLYSKDIVELLFNQPYVRIHNLVEAGIVKRHASSKYLRTLTSIGYLTEFKVGREVIFVNKKFLDLLKQDS